MISVRDFTGIINSVLPEPHAGLLSGILFGTKMSIDPLLKQALVSTGTLHIVALSGMNITILASIVNISLLWLFPRKIASIVTIFVIIGFILFVGPSASVIRAGIMGGISLVAIIFGKNLWALWSWGVAVVGMLLVRPMWITDLSFQLSVLASLGIICFGKPSTVASTIPDGTWESNWSDLEKNNRHVVRRKVIRHLREVLWDDLQTTLAAQTFTIPILFVTFGRLSFISPLTNVLIGWTIPIVTVLGLFVSVFGFVFFPIGQVFAWISWIFLEYIIQIITWTSRIPFASIEW